MVLTGIGAAQQLTGSLEGTIKDTTGGLLPGTAVELRNVATGIVQSQVAGIAGYYSFSAVPPGVYKVQASLKGFRTVIQDVTVELNKTARADFTLAIGTRAEQVVVPNERGWRSNHPAAGRPWPYQALPSIPPC